MFTLRVDFRRVSYLYNIIYFKEEIPQAILLQNNLGWTINYHINILNLFLIFIFNQYIYINLRRKEYSRNEFPFFLKE